MIFYEYAIDVAEACRARGIKTVAVTAGSIKPGPRAEFFRAVDAANVDLKAFTDRFYWRRTASNLAPVLDTLKYLRRETDVWLEITTLLIPGENDSESEIDALTRWVVQELGDETPLHFSAFHPDYRMLDLPPTPKATLFRAREQGRANGLRHVYVGNVRDAEGEATDCVGCGAPLIRRDGYRLDPLRARRQRRLPQVRTLPRRPIRRYAGNLGRAAAAGRHRGVGVNTLIPRATRHLLPRAGEGFRPLSCLRERAGVRAGRGLYTNIARSLVTLAFRCSQTARMRPRPRVSAWVTSQ